MTLKRGEIYYITFPYTFDPRYPNGKGKFVLVLQEGEYFSRFDTVEILLVTSNARCNNQRYVTNVEIPQGETKLNKRSWVVCSQPYPVAKSLFEADGVWCAGTLKPDTLDDIDAALYEGLCMGLQHELAQSEGDDCDDCEDCKETENASSVINQ